MSATPKEQREGSGFGYYEARLVTIPLGEDPLKSPPPDADTFLYVEPVIRKPDDVHLVPPGSIPIQTQDETLSIETFPEKKERKEHKEQKEVTEKHSVPSKVMVSFSEMSKTAMPKLLLDKLSKKGVSLQGRSRLLFTEEERAAIYNAIEKGQFKTKIRRTHTGKPGAKIKRAEKSSKPFTELEKQLNLEFSVIIDNDRQPIALFRGKSDYLVGFGGLGVVKFGQRLNDGRWVAVKIQKNDLQYLNSLKADLKIKNEALSDLNNIIKNMSDSTTDSSYAYRMVCASRLRGEIISLEKEIKRIEEFHESKKKLIKGETEFLKVAGMYLGETERLSGNQEKFYSVQVLLEGIEFFEYVGKPEFRGYMHNVEDRLDAVLLALEDLKKFHDKNIIHGDIKPDNMILLQDQDSDHKFMKLIDFGMSVKLESGAESAMVKTKGTKLYKPPEYDEWDRNDSHPIYKASDIYSIGKIIELIIYDERYFPEINLYPDLKKELHSLLVKMEAKKFDQRPTVDAVIEELNNIINNHKNRRTFSAPKY